LSARSAPKEDLHKYGFFESGVGCEMRLPLTDVKSHDVTVPILQTSDLGGGS
jgi:hypothetical protein